MAWTPAHQRAGASGNANSQQPAAPSGSTGQPAGQSATGQTAGHTAEADDWGSYVPADGTPLPSDPPPPPEGGRRREKGSKIQPGKYTAWVDGITRWPRGDNGGSIMVVQFYTTTFESIGWDQEPGEALLREENETAYAYWTRDLCTAYAALGFPDEGATKWARAPAADGTKRRVPPFSHFWHVNARGQRAPIAFEVHIRHNRKGYPELDVGLDDAGKPCGILPLAGPRLAPLPTTLPRDLAAKLKWPGYEDAEISMEKRGLPPIPIAKSPVQQYLSGTDLVTIESLLPPKRLGSR